MSQVLRRWKIRKEDTYWWVYSKGLFQSEWKFVNYYSSYEKARELVHDTVTLYDRLEKHYDD